MSAIIYAQLSYPLSDFVASSGVVNEPVFKQELDDAGLSVTVQSVSVSDTVCNVFFSGDLLAADITAVDAVVAAHEGEPFGSLLQSELSESLETDDSGDVVVKAARETGPMPAGTFLISWYLEIATTSNTGTSGARGLLYVTKNGGSQIERGISHNSENQFRAFSGSLATSVLDGENYKFELGYQRIGVAGNAARAQRARLTWTRLGD